MASFIGTNTITNPLTSPIDANGFNIVNGATYQAVRSEVVTLAVPTSSGFDEILCEDNLLIEDSALRFSAPTAGTTSIKIQGAPGFEAELGPLPAGAQANIIGYDTATNKLTFFATPGGGGGTITGVGAGSNIVVDNTNPVVPVVSLAEPITYTAPFITTTYDVAGLSQVAFDPATGLGRFDTAVATGNASAFIGGGAVASGTHSLRLEVPVGDAIIQHETLSGTNKNLVISSEGATRVQGGVGSIQNQVIVGVGATGVQVQCVGFEVNSAGNANTLQGGLNQLIGSIRNEFNAGSTAGNANPNTFITSGAGGATNPMIRMENTNATGSCATEIYKNKPTAGANGDVLYTESVFGKDSGNVKQEYTRITHTIRDATAGAEDGSMELGCFVNGGFTNFIQLNANDAPIGEVNLTRPLDFIGGSDANATIKCSGSGSVNLNIDSTNSVGTGAIALKTKNGVAGSGGGLLLTGNTLLSGSAGGSSGQHLCLTIGGTVYKINLFNP